MSIRRDTKRQLIALRTLLRSKQATQDQVYEIEARILNLEGQLSGAAQDDKDLALRLKRREILASNSGLHEVFEAFWTTFSSFTDSNANLTKDGYLKFNQYLQCALVGQGEGQEKILQNAENEWDQDTRLHGPIDMLVFWDILFETIDTWSELIDPSHYAAFAWTLLDAIADTKKQPPRLRNRRIVRCFTTIENEAVCF